VFWKALCCQAECFWGPSEKHSLQTFPYAPRGPLSKQA
jgi:hypothetical protein